MEKIKYLLEENNPIKDLSDIKLDESDLNELVQELNKQNTHVTFINWKEHNKSILDDHPKLREEIQTILIRNQLNATNSRLVIDLSECDLDLEYLECLKSAIKTDGYSGFVYLGPENEAKFGSFSNEFQNLEKFTRYASDYVHAKLARCVRTGSDIPSQFAQSGWKIHDELKVKNHVSVIYINPKTRHIVTAFKGLTSNVPDLLSDRNLSNDSFLTFIANELASMLFYACVHSRVAIELSRQTGYGLSFTGYSYGAWLAELCVYFSYVSNDGLAVRAVTFESPGSYEAIDKLNSIQIENRGLSMNELSENLDIKAYLFAPNLINTCQRHVGKVYRIVGKDLSKEKESIERFFEDKIINSVEASTNINAWYTNAQTNYPQSRFYFQSLQTIFDEELDRLADMFNEETGTIADCISLYEVLEWPKIIELENVANDNNNIEILGAEFFFGFIHTKKIGNNNLKSIIENFSSFINVGVRRVVSQTMLPNLQTVFGLLTDMKSNTNTIEWKDQLDWMVTDREEVKKEGKLSLLANIECQVDYHTKRADLKSDHIKPTRIDRELVELKNKQSERYQMSKMSSWFKKLDESYTIEDENQRVRSTSANIDLIRERLEIVLNIESKLKQIETQKQTSISNVFGSAFIDEFFNTPEDILTSLEEKIHKNYLIFIHGDSGSGKTTLSNQFAHYLKQKDSSITILYIRSNSHKSNMEELARRVLNYPISSQRLSQLIERVFARLNSQRCLIIIDDVKSVHELGEITSHMDKSLHKLIVTSKSSCLFASKTASEIYSPSSIESLKLSKLDKSDAVKYVEKFAVGLREEVQRADFTEVSPLVLKLAITNYQNNKNDTSQFLTLNNNTLKELVVKFLKDNNPLAFDLLQYSSFLDGQSISKEILEKICNRIIGHTGSELEEALKYLLDNQWLSWNENTNSLAFEMHELIQEEFKKNISSDARRLITHDLIEILDTEFTIRDETQPRLLELNRHVEQLLEFSHQLKDNERFVRLLEKSAVWYAFELRDADKASKMALFRKRYSKLSDYEMVKFLLQVGRLYFEEDRCEDSWSNYAKSLEILKNDVDTPCIKSLIESIHRNISRKSNDEEPIAIETFPPNYLIDRVSNNIDDFTRLAHIEEILVRIIEVNRARLGWDKHFYLPIYHGYLAIVYHNQKNYEKALENYAQVVDVYMMLSAIGYYIAVANIRVYMGLCQLELDRYGKALENFQTSLRAFESQQEYGDYYSNTMKCLEKIGTIYKHQRGFQQAEEYFSRGLKLARDKSNYIEVARILDLMGNLKIKSGEIEAGEECFKEALELRKTHRISADHVDMASSYSYLGLFYCKQEDYPNAVENYGKAFDIRRKLPDVLESASVAVELAIVYQKQRDFEKALEMYLESLDLKRIVLPADHEDIANAYNNIGIIYLSLKRYGDALTCLEKTYRIFDQTKHPETSQVRNLIDGVRRQKELADSRK